MNYKLFYSKNEYSSDSFADMHSLFGISSGGITISNAQKIATVFSCVNIKANALAVIPMKIYKKVKYGKKEYRESSIYNLLRYEPNPNLIASLYKKMISQDIDLRGNHYSQIIRNGLGDVVALYPLIADKMDVSLDKNGKKVYRYNGRKVDSRKILHIYDIPDSEGIKGLSRIEYAKQALEFASNTASHGNQLFKNGISSTGMFETPAKLSDEAYKRLKKDLRKQYNGLSNRGKTMLLEEGLTFKPLDMKNSDAEWLESRKFNREEIASIFGVPVAMLNDSTNTAYGNLEQKYLEFYTGTVFPLTTILEEQFRLSLFTPSQKKELSIKFKFNTMLRVDAKTRAEYYKTRFNTGSLSPNQICEYEGENGFEGGDERYLQLNLSTVKNLNKGGDDS